MIELHRPPESAAADAIATELRRLVVAFREVEDAGLASPRIEEGSVAVTDPGEIAAYLAELRRDVAQWNAFQSDACFVEDDGTIC